MKDTGRRWREPALQNIPIRTAEGRKLRDAFVPKSDEILVHADYSAIEFRIFQHNQKKQP